MNKAIRTTGCGRLWLAVLALGAVAMAPGARGDEMYARSRTYDLQNVRVELRFDTPARKVMGEVTHTLAPLNGGLSQLEFDSVDLTIAAVSVDGKAAKFETTPGKLIVHLAQPARAGQKLSVRIRYEGQPKRGLYFVLPDKNTPDRPVQIWTQGQTEDTRYYIPIYDYPNDRTTSEMIVTVPAAWTTVSNGRLVSAKSAASGMKTWHWRQSQPHATYLIALVAGEFDVTTGTAAGVPLSYYAPRGRGDRLAPSYGHTPEMMKLFTEKFGPYRWDKYGQAMVDEFVAGGMENTSITINTSDSLTHPALVKEYVTNQDDLISHELGHQWFGDLITTKDWGNVWVSEGFASYLESIWQEHYFGPEQAEFNGWSEQNNWFRQARLFPLPLVNYQMESFVEVTGNVYGKGSRIVHMLRHELGDEDFFRAMRHYLKKHGMQNVASADLAASIEEATGKNVDPFFQQWVYGAGAPRLAVAYTWDAAAKQVKLNVTQTQKEEGRVGLFSFPVTVDVMTAAGVKSHALRVSKKEEEFVLPAEEKPLTVVFDPHGVILKRVEFKKEAAEWTEQLRHPAVAARLDAARALARVKDNAEAMAALKQAASGDQFWAVRSEALRALAQAGGAAAIDSLKAALADESVAVRRTALDMLGRSKDAAVLPRVEQALREDKAWRVRESALAAIGQLKAENAVAVMQQAIAGESPDAILRDRALQSLGGLGKDEVIPLLLEWAAPTKEESTRAAAISSLGPLGKKDGEITKTLLAYLQEPGRSVRFQFTVFENLLQREDPSVTEPMQKWLDSGAAGILVGFLQPRLDQFKAQIAKAADGAGEKPGQAAGGDGAAKGDAGMKQILDALQRLEQAVGAMNQRLQKLEEKTGKN